MESACVYEQTTVIHELTQGIEMAKQLRLNLNSAEAREFLIHKILSSYDKALFTLKSAGQPRANPLPESSLPKSSISTVSPKSGEFEFGFEFEFDENAVSKKRKASTPWENEVEGNTNDVYSWKKRRDENPTVYKGIPTCNNVVQSAPPPPPSPEKHEIKPTHHHQQLSTPNPGEVLSNLRANLSVNTWDLSAILPSSLSFSSTPFGFSDDDFEALSLPNHFDDELLQVYSPPFISPDTSESNYLTDWGISSSLDFTSDPEDLYPDFTLFNNCFL
ncbi:uncharacterized protein LOC111918784 [Lactuca sativa]|uniref:WRKY domain-containing protein n=1 Tax=Lactuca sativa TaxID=4236 RepID=A0A9R1V5F0_LACSA|nr:uncharacterized protein LOC111918784 [Lactuca sativa]KAJ0199214.1 hypothetical protein LSAT_V11C600302340 [Lactuca sativa]